MPILQHLLVLPTISISISLLPPFAPSCLVPNFLRPCLYSLFQFASRKRKRKHLPALSVILCRPFILACAICIGCPLLIQTHLVCDFICLFLLLQVYPQAFNSSVTRFFGFKILLHLLVWPLSHLIYFCFLPKKKRVLSLPPIMDTPKPRSRSSDATKKVSPRVARQLNLNPVGFGSSSPASPSTTSTTRSPKDRTSKLPERKSPRSPLISEKKRPSRVSELETQISELQEDLKKVKKELNASKASKKEAEAIAEGLQQQLSIVSSNLEESQKQLAELRASKGADVAELKGISEEKDRAWETQLDIVQKQHSIDASALASALDEIQTLKKQLEMVAKCEDDNIELQGLKSSLSETLLVLEKMKTEMEGCKKSEALAQGLVQETLVQLEEAKQTVNALRNDGMKAMGDYNTVASELEDSKARVALLEGMVNKVKAHESEIVTEDHQNGVDELRNLRSEVGELKATIEELKANLMDKETELQFISEENESLSLKLRKSGSNEDEEDKSEDDDLKRVREEVLNLKANLMDKETELQNIKEENENLKSELKCPESTRTTAANEDTLEGMKEEAEKNKRRAERAAEQLEAAQAANAELEAELRRLKVQSDQWRKAAEAAASMLSSPVGNGRLVQRTGSLDNRSPYLDDFDFDDDDDDDEDAFKKKHGNVLRKIGGFWKKPQK